MNNKQIKKAYQDIYPELESHYTILMSQKFFLPTVLELTEAIKKHSVKDMKYRDNITDCEKFAWYLIWGIQKERSENLTKKITWSVGWATGLRMDFMGSEPHTMATAITSDHDIVIIDPRTDAISKPDPETFNILLLVM